MRARTFSSVKKCPLIASTPHLWNTHEWGWHIYVSHSKVWQIIIPTLIAKLQKSTLSFNIITSILLQHILKGFLALLLYSFLESLRQDMDQGLRMIIIVSSLQSNENQEMKICLQLTYDVHWPGKICQSLIKACQKTPFLRNPWLTEEDKSSHLPHDLNADATHHSAWRTESPNQRSRPWTLLAAAVLDCEIRGGLISSPDHLVTSEVGLKSNFDQKFKTQHCSSTQPPLSSRHILICH